MQNIAAFHVPDEVDSQKIQTSSHWFQHNTSMSRQTNKLRDIKPIVVLHLAYADKK